MATTSLNGFDEYFLKTHAGMTSVVIHSNKTVSREVKDKNAIQSHMKGQDGRRVGGPYLLLGQPGIKKTSTRIAPLKSITVCVLLSQH